MRPLISVIILTYKNPTLFEALDSVLLQDYDNIQLIVADDATPGLRIEEIKTYIDEKKAANIREYIVIRHDENIGTVRSLNKAIVKATGKIIFTLAGDDCFAHQTILSKWTIAFEESRCDIMTAFCDIYDQTMTQYIETRPSQKQADLLRTKSARELFKLNIKDYFIPGCCIARTKRFVKEHGLHDERFKLIEDAPSIFSIWSRNESIGFWDHVAVKHRTGGSSTPANINADYENDLMNIYELIIKPHSNQIRKDKKNYFKYISRHKRARKYEFYRDKYENSKIMLLLLGVWFYSKYPVTTIRRLSQEPEIILKKINLKVL